MFRIRIIADIYGLDIGEEHTVYAVDRVSSFISTYFLIWNGYGWSWIDSDICVPI